MNRGMMEYAKKLNQPKGIEYCDLRQAEYLGKSYLLESLEINHGLFRVGFSFVS